MTYEPKSNDSSWSLVQSAIEALEKRAPETELLALARKLDKVPMEWFTSNQFRPIQIAVLSGYTVDFLLPLLRLALLRARLYPLFFQVPFGTFEQAIYRRDEELGGFRPDLCYFCVGSDHLGWTDSNAEAQRWLSLWSATRDWLNCDIVANTFEKPPTRPFGNLEFKLTDTGDKFVQRLNDALAKAAPSYVHFNDVCFLSDYFGRGRWRDWRLYDLARIPVASEFFLPYARSVASILTALYGRSPKCLVVDLDNTLWGGVIGDDGPEGIAIGPGNPIGEAFQRFQLFLKVLHERGVLLAVCSKNEESLARAAFTEVPSMLLKLEHFSVFMANWENKPDNLRKIARLLNIGTDSLIFVDDNPLERELVRKSLPEVAVIELPSDPSLYRSALEDGLLFDTVAFTQEDRSRALEYRNNQIRQEEERSAPSYEVFLKNLKMEASIEEVHEENLGRVTQLINKTNQFNLTTRRYTESQVSSLVNSKSWLCRAIRLRDKYGDNGLISVLIGEIRKEGLHIDTWLMSCRVLKRRVENLLMQHLVQWCRDKKLPAIRGTYIPTAKNGLVENLYADLGFSRALDSLPQETRWLLPMESTAAQRLFEEVLPIAIVPPPPRAKKAA